MFILDSERMEGIRFAVEWNGGSQAFGFLSGPVETLRKARTAGRLELELDDGTKVTAKMLQVSDTGMGLVSINPQPLKQRQI